MRENRTSGSMRGRRKRAYATRLCSTLPEPPGNAHAAPISKPGLKYPCLYTRTSSFSVPRRTARTDSGRCTLGILLCRAIDHLWCAVPHLARAVAADCTHPAWRKDKATQKCDLSARQARGQGRPSPAGGRSSSAPLFLAQSDKLRGSGGRAPRECSRRSHQ